MHVSPMERMPNSSLCPAPRIVILIPCLNEETTIGKVVRDFKRELPEAEVVVYDNDSTDRTAEVALEAGASLRHEKRRGKGYAVQSMFRQTDADIFVLVDGDDTYPAECVRALIAPVLSGQSDMTVGSRLAGGLRDGFRQINWAGNRLYLRLINAIFGTRLTDVLSGYRCMSRDFVRGLPLFVTGFEVEAELTVKALERGFRIDEIPVPFRSRPPGSRSKLRVVQDGFKILWTIFALSRDYKPLTFFGTVGLAFIGLGFVPGFIAVSEFVQTGLVLHFPSAILAVGLVLSGMLLIVIGLILHTINRRFQEMEYYLQQILKTQ